MTTILDLSLLAIAIAIYLAMANATKPKLKPIKGSRIIVKARNIIVHQGTIERFDGDVAICYKEPNGTRIGREQFAAWASHLFWSESEQAFIERI